MTIFRLTRARYSPKGPTGAILRGGGWSSPGNAVLYASSTLSLACLEILVHIRDVGLIPTDYVYSEIDAPDGWIKRWELAGTEEELAKIESPVLSREWGDHWYRRTTAANYREESRRWESLPLDIRREFGLPGPAYAQPVLAVPSVIIARELNYLISTVHPSFNSLQWSEPRPFRFDPRLIAAAE